MSYEAGGRADKEGNKYEVKYFILQLLKVVEEEIASATLEALGDDEKGTDIWIEKKNGLRESQQCKGRYANNDNWNFFTLEKYDIFKNWKIQLERNKNYFVSLVSPISFVSFEDLIKRAKNTSDNPKEFYENQIMESDDKMINCFKRYCDLMNLDPLDDEDLIKCIDYLNRTNYHQIPDEELKSIILNKIKYLFIGNGGEIYNYFVELVMDENIYAKRIDITYIDCYIKSKNIMYRNLSKDDRIFPRIRELNNEYNYFFTPINDSLMEREEFVKCKDLIEEGKSIIINGKAGYGKSGITQLISQYCEKNEIPYLAIKLDKRLPRDNAEEWGIKLGLPTSIGFCIDSISKDRKAVIILDQLDALRWTQLHSREALLVCAELINQIENLNFGRKHKISIVFVCRTYDLENDNNIKALFKNDRYSDNWKKIDVEKFSKEKLELLIGKKYKTFSKKLQELLRIPSNLYIWNKLDKNQTYDDCKTTNMLIQKWWNQLLKNANEIGISEKEIQECKNNIVFALDNTDRTGILIKMLQTTISALDYLTSNGFLIIKNDIVSFTHQSLLDYFLEEKMLQDYQNGSNVDDIVGDKTKQTPAKRYQVQMLLDDLANSDTQDFISVGKNLLESNNIRFYIKHVFFEVLGQITEIDYNIEQFVLEYYNNSRYSSHILNNVISSHPQYVNLLIKNGILDVWMQDNKKKDMCINLLCSIKDKYTAENVNFISKYLFNSEEDDKEIYRCFNYNINDDIDEMFELRMKLYNKYPELSDEYIDFKKMMEDNELRVIRLMKFWIDNKVKNKNKRIYKYEELITEESDIIVNNDEKIIETLLSVIPQETDLFFGDWTGRYKYKIGIERACVNLIKKANANLIKRKPGRFWEIYERYLSKGFPIFNEFILEGFALLPIGYSDKIIEYLCEDFEKNIFDVSSGNGDKLQLVKKVLCCHSGHCSDSVFKKIEDKIYYYYNEKEVKELYKQIRECKMNYTYKKMPWDWWGNLQVELIPFLSKERLSPKTRSLNEVLQRRFENGSNYYKYSDGHSGGVWSPIEGKKLSNKQWMRLLSNKDLKTKERYKWKEVKGGFIESSLREFASSFSAAVSNEPIRMINLVLNGGDVILEEYIESLYNGISSSDKLDEISNELFEKILKKYPCDNISQRARNLCWIINKKKDVNWSASTLQLLRDISINHIDPILGKPNVTNEKDEEIRSVEMLRSNSLNCTRGAAVRAISHVLWNKKELFEEFKDVINSLSTDKNPVIRFASLHCLFVTYYIDKDWSTHKIIELFESDERFLCFWETRNLLFSMYNENRERILSIIEKAYCSEIKEVREFGAICVAEMYIINNEFPDLINNVQKIDNIQCEQIIRIIEIYYDKLEYNEKCKNIILEMNKYNYNLESFISRIFYDEKINLKRDRDFLNEIIKTNSGRRAIHAMIKYIEENSLSILDFSEMILEILNSFINSETDLDNIYYYGDELSKLVVGLYDETVGKKQEDMKVLNEKCLNIWDQMFEKQIGTIRALSKQLLDR